MTSRDFCYWLQGCFEISETTTWDAKQLKVVQCHLSLVFKHEIDPSFGDEKHQQVLNELHDGPPLRPPLHGPSIHHEPLFRC